MATAIAYIIIDDFHIEDQVASSNGKNAMPETAGLLPKPKWQGLRLAMLSLKGVLEDSL